MLISLVATVKLCSERSLYKLYTSLHSTYWHHCIYTNWIVASAAFTFPLCTPDYIHKQWYSLSVSKCVVINKLSNNTTIHLSFYYLAAFKIMSVLSCISDLSHLWHFRVCFLSLSRKRYIPHNQWHIPHNQWSINLKWHKTNSYKQHWDYWRYISPSLKPISILYSVGG